jgi:hypothetical protein
MKQEKFGEYESYPEINIHPDPRIPYDKLTLTPSSIQRLAKDCGIPEARRADLTNFLKFTSTELLGSFGGVVRAPQEVDRRYRRRCKL